MQSMTAFLRNCFHRQVAETLTLSSVTLAELWFGLPALPSGKRKDMLAQALDGLLPLFGDRVLTFDSDAARCFAALGSCARSEGRALPLADGYIAAIAVVRGFIVATRDITPFHAVGVAVINPWIAPA